MTEKELRKEYLIYINSKSEPVLVPVPEKPTRCRMPECDDLCKCDLDLEAYYKLLNSALSDESKHIRIRESDYNNLGINWNTAKVGQNFPLPEGIFVRVEEQNCGCYYLKGPSPECIEAGGKNPYKCVRGAIKVALVYKQKSKYVQEPKVEEQIIQQMIQDLKSNPGWCVSCETEKNVHELCLECAIKLGHDNPKPEEQLKEKQDLYTELKNWLCEIVPHDNWAGKKVTKDDGQYFAINDGKRFVAFNHDTKFGKTFFGIREDGDSRTVFNGVVETLEDAKRIWYLTDPSN